jgi:hypothetical protein
MTDYYAWKQNLKDPEDRSGKRGWYYLESRKENRFDKDWACPKLLEMQKRFRDLDQNQPSRLLGHWQNRYIYSTADKIDHAHMQ